MMTEPTKIQSILSILSPPVFFLYLFLLLFISDFTFFSPVEYRRAWRGEIKKKGTNNEYNNKHTHTLGDRLLARK